VKLLFLLLLDTAAAASLSDEAHQRFTPSQH
jgi:hypothetical protein